MKLRCGRIQDAQRFNLKGDLGEVRLEAVEVRAEDVGLGEVIDELAFFFRANQPGGFELFHVVGEGGRRDVDAIAHGATRGTGALRADFLEDLVPARISEGAGDECKLVFGKLDGLNGGSHSG